MIPEYLKSPCFEKITHGGTGFLPVCDGFCGHSVKSAPGGRWFITIGHAGFNSPKNNAGGYVSFDRAFRAMQGYLKQGVRI